MATVDTALDFIAKMPDILRSARSDSLIEFTQPTRVEPITIVDDRIVNWTHANELMQSLTSIFSGYYLQAIALSVNVGRVDVLRLLDRVNPNRSLDDAAVHGLTNLGGLRGAFEDATFYKYSLPVPGEAIGLEAFGTEANDQWLKEQKNRREEEALQLSKDKFELDKQRAESEKNKGKGAVSSDFGKSIDIAQQATNLSVGKLLEVEIEDGGKKATFPVAVRLIVSAMAPDGIVHILSMGSKDKSLKERWHQWRSGQIEFIRDLVLCQDLIDEHKQGLMKDKSNIFSQSIMRRKKNRLSSLLTMTPSVATASNIVVLADETRKELERNIGGRLKDFRTRERLFKQTYAMLMVVVDPEWDSVTIYHRSIETPTDLSARDIKVANNKGVDVGEILKAYRLGSSPSF